MKGVDLAAMTKNDIEKLFVGLVAKCSGCNEPVFEHPDLQYLVDGNAVHESCYYSKLGELVESNPLGHPRRYSS